MCELGGTATMQNEKRKRVDSGGFVVDHVQVKIVDLTTGEVLGPNQPGELYCKSPTMMLGYYKNPTATEETIDEEGMFGEYRKTFFLLGGYLVCIVGEQFFSFSRDCDGDILVCKNKYNFTIPWNDRKKIQDIRVII